MRSRRGGKESELWRGNSGPRPKQDGSVVPRLTSREIKRNRAEFSVLLRTLRLKPFNSEVHAGRNIYVYLVVVLEDAYEHVT